MCWTIGLFLWQPKTFTKKEKGRERKIARMCTALIIISAKNISFHETNAFCIRVIQDATPKTMYNVLLCTKNKASIGRFCAAIKLRPWSFVRHFLVFCLLKTDAKKVVLYEALTFAIRHKFNLDSKTVCSFYLEWINKATLNTIFIVLPKKPKDLFMWWRSNARYFSCSEL